MNISKKLLLISALLLGIQPTTYAFTGSGYGDVFNLMFYGSIAATIATTAAAIFALTGNQQPIKPIINEILAKNDYVSRSAESTIMDKIGLAVLFGTIVAGIGKYWYENYKFNNFIKLLHQKDKEENLKLLAQWIEYRDNYEYSMTNSQRTIKYTLHEIINNTKSTFENKIESLSKLMNEFPIKEPIKE
jgi:hypothetical protein